jgi:hypothetical protein
LAVHRNDQWVGGAVLIAIGVALLLGQLYEDIEQYILLGIGIALLVLFAATRNPGTLIGGGIVTGLGLGVIAATMTEGDIAGAAVLFGLGGGFIAVWLIGYLLRMRETAFWPLIPGTILIIVGMVVLAGSEAADQVATLWPIVLIGLGVIVLVAALRGRGAAPVGSAAGSATAPGASTAATAPGAGTAEGVRPDNGPQDGAAGPG